MKNNIVIVLIFLVNLIGLYLIIDLANYDEATAYLENGIKKASLGKPLVFLLFAIIGNILFLAYSFYQNRKNDSPKKH